MAAIATMTLYVLILLTLNARVLGYPGLPRAIGKVMLKMHISAENDVKHIRDSIGWYYGSKFIQWKNIHIFQIYVNIVFSVCYWL